MLKEASVKDEQYEDWIKKCIQKNSGTIENLYQIDAEGFLRFKNRIYVPNLLNVKHIVFKSCMIIPMQDTPVIKNL